eukprot:s815_g6.t1
MGGLESSELASLSTCISHVLGFVAACCFTDCNIYGYVAATRVKVLAIVRDGACRQRRDEEAILRSMLRQVNLLYVDAASNPFYSGLGKARFCFRTSRP